MPLYDYQCNKCGNVIEKFFKMSEKPQKFEEICPSCNTYTTFNSIISPVSFLYMGINHSAKVPSDLKERFRQIKKHYPNMQTSVE